MEETRSKEEITKAAIALMKYRRAEEKAYRERIKDLVPRPVQVGDIVRLYERMYEIISFEDDGLRFLGLMVREDGAPTYSYRYIYLREALHLDYSPIEGQNHE